MAVTDERDIRRTVRYLPELVDEEAELRERARHLELDPGRVEEARALFEEASRLAAQRLEVVRWLLGLR